MVTLFHLSMFKPDRCVTYSVVSSTLLITCPGPPQPPSSSMWEVRTSVMGGVHLWPPFLLELHTFCVLNCAMSLVLVYPTPFYKERKTKPLLFSTNSFFLWHSSDTVVVNRWFEQLCILKDTTEIAFGMICSRKYPVVLSLKSGYNQVL